MQHTCQGCAQIQARQHSLTEAHVISPLRFHKVIFEVGWWRSYQSPSSTIGLASPAYRAFLYILLPLNWFQIPVRLSHTDRAQPRCSPTTRSSSRRLGNGRPNLRLCCASSFTYTSAASRWLCPIPLAAVKVIWTGWLPLRAPRERTDLDSHRKQDISASQARARLKCKL